MRNTKKGVVLIACLSLLLLLPGLSNAEKVKVRVIVEKANIRLKPDLGSMVIGSAPLGAILESDEQIGEWFKVNLPPDEKGFVVTGYIHSSAVEVVEEKAIEEKAVEEKPVSPPPVPPRPPQQPAYQNHFLVLGLDLE
ncbi:MAG: SH3 domain-containing protein [Candidatus Aminicenantia bacterium]